jgi:hypothetical protein
VYVAPPPATTVLTPSVFVTERSALVVTVFVSEAVLLPLSGSLTWLETVAVFAWLPVVELGTVYVTVTVADPPFAIVPSEQLKLGDPLQLPCDGVTAPRLKPAGQVSVTPTPVASDGPAFATVIVYV